MWPLLILVVVFSVVTALLTPTQKAHRGQLKDFTFPQLNDGDPVVYLAGTAKITGPGLTWYGNFRSKAIKTGGFFGIGAQTIGYKYYLGWQLVFCLGPDVHLKKLWFGTKSGQKEALAEENDPNFTNPNDPKVPTPIYSGNFTTGHLHLVDLNAFGGDQGGGGYDLNVWFFGGEATQPTSTYLQKQLKGSFVPPYKGICHLVVDGYIGNTTQLQNMTAELSRIYDPLGLGVKAVIGTEGDANPANVLYELLTNNFGAASIPIARMNIASFVAAGNTLYDEDEGISIAFGGSSVQLSAVVQDILRQIDATLYEDPETGQANLKLIRPDYDVTTLPQIDQTNIISVSNFAINLWSDTKNRIRLKYEDRKKDYNDRTAVGEDMANVSFQRDQVKAINVEHPYIKRKAHANRKAAKELAIYSTPIAALSVSALRFSTSLRPGSVIKLQYPDYNIIQYVYRVKSISYGDLINNRLVIELTGDKFAQTDEIFGLVDTGFSQPYSGAATVVAWTVDETPRWFNTVQTNIINVDAPRVMVYPVQPEQTQQAFNLWAKTSTEVAYTQITTRRAYPNFAATNAAITQTGEADITLQSITDNSVLEIVSAGQIKNSGLNLIQIDSEIMAYEGWSQDMTTGVYTLTGVHRALLDTPPAAHAKGAYVTFLDQSQVGKREFGPTDTVDLLIGSVSSSSEQTADEAKATTITLTNRPLRPYPPAEVTFNGTILNPALSNASAITVTWKRRNRKNEVIQFMTDADEDIFSLFSGILSEGVTEYFIKHDGFEENLGSGTSGSFHFTSDGTKTVEFYARRGTLESNHIIFTTTVTGSPTPSSSPLAPASITATPAAFSNIVSWAGSTGASQYDVYGLLGTGLFSSSAIVGTTSGVTFTHENLSADQEWSYWVVARNSHGSSSQTGPAVSTTYGGGAGTTQSYFGDGPPTTPANNGDTYTDTSGSTPITYIQISGSWVSSSIYDTVFSYTGIPPASTSDFIRLNVVRSFYWPAGLTGADITAVAPSATVVITLYQNASVIGTLTWAAGSGRTAPTISFASQVAFALDDEITWSSPSDLHGLKDIAATIAGFR